MILMLLEHEYEFRGFSSRNYLHERNVESNHLFKWMGCFLIFH